MAHFGTAVDATIAGLRLEAFLPANEATAALLADLTRPDDDPPHPGQELQRG